MNNSGISQAFVSFKDAPLTAFVLVATSSTAATAIFTDSDGVVAESKTFTVTTSPQTLVALYGAAIPNTYAGCVLVVGSGGTVFCAPAYDGSMIIYTPSAANLSQSATQGSSILIGTGIPASLVTTPVSPATISDVESGSTATVDAYGSLSVQPYYSYGGTPTKPACGPNGEGLFVPGRGNVVQVLTRNAGSIEDCIVSTANYPGAVFHINVVAGSGSAGFDTYGNFQANYDGIWILCDAQQVVMNPTSAAILPTQSFSPTLYTSSDTVWQVYAPGADQIRYQANTPGSNDTVTTYGYPAVVSPFASINRNFFTHYRGSSLSGTTSTPCFNREYRNMLSLVQITPSDGATATGTFTPKIEILDSQFSNITLSTGGMTSFSGSTSYTYLIAAGIDATSGIGTHQIQTLLPPEFYLSYDVTLSSGTYNLVVRSCFLI